MSMIREALNQLVCCVVRQAHHERNQSLAVRHESFDYAQESPVEGLVQRCSDRPLKRSPDGCGVRQLPAGQRGLSMIELLVFIVVVGIAVTGVLQVYSSTSRTSVDPMVRKQALAVAESLLDEVLSKPYTYCDPDDANVYDDTVTSSAGCAIPEVMGPETGETRYSNTTPFDNVNDYDGFFMDASTTGINDLTGTPIPGLVAYTALVSVQDTEPLHTISAAALPNAEVLFVTVTVTGPGNHSITLSGYRTRYAPTL